MKFIQFDKSNCDECFKCLRVCPTKAIHFTAERREINNYMCIKCGLCLRTCHSGALSIRSDLYKVKAAQKKGSRLIASVAPSFAGAFPAESPTQFVAALKALGFNQVIETAVAAEIISCDYEEKLGVHTHKNAITSCCPSANYFIESAYPELIPLLLTTVSPMVAHGKMLKEKFGENACIVFIGPCLAKKAEAEEFTDAIDAVLTFREIETWLEAEKIDLNALDPMPFDEPATSRGRAYPLGSALQSHDLCGPLHKEYRYYRAEGTESCMEVLEALKKGTLSNRCVELNICRGSCVNGPDMPMNDLNMFERRAFVEKHIQSSAGINNPIDSIKLFSKKDLQVNLERSFKKRGISIAKPSQSEIKRELLKIGKYTEKDQLNCGACGYATCVDKAMAAINGLADINMCLPFLRHKAESFQMAVFDHSPNIICVMDEELNIQYANRAFDEIMNIRQIPISGVPIYAFIENDIFSEVLESNENRVSHKELVKSLNRIFIFNVLHLKQEKSVLAILTDITAYEKDREDLLRIKEKTIDACQEIIDKQMYVVQEIASLLGETTAETKVNLTKLRDLVIWDERCT